MNEQERKEYIEEYIDFMCDPDNAYNCAECPENKGFETFPETRKPCGQFVCWVECHCQNDD